MNKINAEKDINSGRCCSPKTLHWIAGSVETPSGLVPRVSSKWSNVEKRGEILCRISNSFRMKYSIDPGIYAIGEADQNSPVFLSANYKLSFDMLRRELRGFNAWILVLDTKGINVWCAAGKGTFGTGELINRINSVGLDKIVAHRRLIIPQLGAPGMHAHIVKRETGFAVSYGPVHAKNIPEYVNSGYKATKSMRSVEFTFFDRFVLTPMEVIPALEKFPYVILIMFALFGLKPEGIIFEDSVYGSFPFVVMCIFTIIIGSFLTPVLLPFIPFRSFALKGWLLCIVIMIATCPLIDRWFDGNILFVAISFLFFPAASSYLAFNFTGCTPFTNMSGVKRELKASLPFYFSSAAVSSLLFVFYKLLEWDVL